MNKKALIAPLEKYPCEEFINFCIQYLYTALWNYWHPSSKMVCTKWTSDAAIQSFGFVTLPWALDLRWGEETSVTETMRIIFKNPSLFALTDNISTGIWGGGKNPLLFGKQNSDENNLDVFYILLEWKPISMEGANSFGTRRVNVGCKTSLYIRSTAYMIYDRSWLLLIFNKSPRLKMCAFVISLWHKQ